MYIASLASSLTEFAPAERNGPLVMVMAVSTQVLLVISRHIWYQNDRHEVPRKFPDLICDHEAHLDAERGTGGQTKHTTLINLQLSEPLHQGSLTVWACRMVSNMQNLISDITL